MSENNEPLPQGRSESEQAIVNLIYTSKNMMQLIGDGHLVRNTMQDDRPDWHVRMIHVVNKLRAFQEAIEDCEKRFLNRER